MSFFQKQPIRSIIVHTSFTAAFFFPARAFPFPVAGRSLLFPPLAAFLRGAMFRGDDKWGTGHREHKLRLRHSGATPRFKTRSHTRFVWTVDRRWSHNPQTHWLSRLVSSMRTREIARERQREKSVHTRPGGMVGTSATNKQAGGQNCHASLSLKNIIPEGGGGGDGNRRHLPQHPPLRTREKRVGCCTDAPLTYTS